MYGGQDVIPFEVTYKIIVTGKPRKWIFDGFLERHGLNEAKFSICKEEKVSMHTINRRIFFIRRYSQCLHFACSIKKERIVEEYKDITKLRNKLFRRKDMREQLEKLDRIIYSYRSYLVKFIFTRMLLKTLHHVRATEKEEEIFTRDWILSQIPEDMKKIMEKVNKEHIEKIAELHDLAWFDYSIIDFCKEKNELIISCWYPFVLVKVKIGQNIFFILRCAMGDYEDLVIESIKKALREYGSLFDITRVEIDKEKQTILLS